MFMAGLIIDKRGVRYTDPAIVREHIEALKDYDPDLLADLALGLLADLERERGNEWAK